MILQHAPQAETDKAVSLIRSVFAATQGAWSIGLSEPRELAGM
jgi:hypothetical protein